MDWHFVMLAAVPVIALAALYGQLRHWHRAALADREKAVREQTVRDTQLSRDIEGNTSAVLQLKHSLETHEKKCDERWRRNHEKHDETGQRVAKLEAKQET